MIFRIFNKKNNNKSIIERQYGLLTAAARIPAFYAQMNVPDTVMGRFEMLSTVLIVYFRRTKNSGQSGQEIAQEIIDAFFEDMDHSIRELGIGDVGVPKRMKKLAGMFYGRLESYSKALENHDSAMLAAAFQRNFYPENDNAPSMDDLASYVLSAEQALLGQAEAQVASGNVQFPQPRNSP